MPAVWLPYGSTSINVRVDPEDLAWVVSRDLVTDYSGLIPYLKSGLKELTGGEVTLLTDPTFPAPLREKLAGNTRELSSFDLLSPTSTIEISLQSACLLSCPHPDPLIGFRGLGENLLPFYPGLWKEFTTSFIEAVESGKKIDLKPYLNVLSNNIELKIIIIVPLANDPIVLPLRSPVDAYDALKDIQHRLLVSTQAPVEILIISAGGSPFDETLSRAMSVIPNCLQDAGYERIVLAVEGLKGLGLSPDILVGDTGSDAPLIVKYIGFCRELLKGKTVHVVSAIPELLLRTVLDCRAHDTLTDAYKASRLFLPRGSKIGVVTNASFTILRLERS